MQHHAYFLAAEVEEGIARVEKFIATELGMKVRGNPDVIILRYGLLSMEEARTIADIAASAPLIGDKKAIIIAAGRAYHEAQNALLKVFEEPPKGAHLFLILPELGGLLPTLKSRVAMLEGEAVEEKEDPVEAAKAFIKASKEKRSLLIKKLATGKDEEERREHRDEALAIVNGLEQAAYEKGVASSATFLTDLGQLRAHLHDRSAPVRMILEHLSLTLPEDLV